MILQAQKGYPFVAINPRMVVRMESQGDETAIFLADGKATTDTRPADKFYDAWKQAMSTAPFGR